MKLTLSFFAASVIFFAWGYGVGKRAAPPCPVLVGQSAISSSSDAEGMHCTYVKTTGLATRRVRL